MSQAEHQQARVLTRLSYVMGKDPGPAFKPNAPPPEGELRSEVASRVEGASMSDTGKEYSGRTSSTNSLDALGIVSALGLTLWFSPPDLRCAVWPGTQGERTGGEYFNPTAREYVPSAWLLSFGWSALVRVGNLPRREATSPSNP
jgi:hypothetical protein